MPQMGRAPVLALRIPGEWIHRQIRQVEIGDWSSSQIDNQLCRLALQSNCLAAIHRCLRRRAERRQES